ncbi:hypothetical protein IEQ34_007722 [Dendrobium chrysotoxum]|uniref:Uncharacterized protein n=1 Tax=Dendrobium chrysotoxum TaxID=161865 RepID=A0AAV7GMT6_DENCH|nr:hypothetical protein IEQ34_007722 [Dendrobium chrysotoxum]
MILILPGKFCQHLDTHGHDDLSFTMRHMRWVGIRLYLVESARQGPWRRHSSPPFYPDCLAVLADIRLYPDCLDKARRRSPLLCHLLVTRYYSTYCLLLGSTLTTGVRQGEDLPYFVTFWWPVTNVFFILPSALPLLQDKAIALFGKEGTADSSDDEPHFATAPSGAPSTAPGPSQDFYQNIVQYFDRMDQRFDDMEAHLKRQDDQFDAVNTNIATLNSYFSLFGASSLFEMCLKSVTCYGCMSIVRKDSGSLPYLESEKDDGSLPHLESEKDDGSLPHLEGEKDDGTLPHWGWLWKSNFRGKKVFFLSILQVSSGLSAENGAVQRTSNSPKRSSSVSRLLGNSFAGAMKFKDSPVIELTVGGKTLSFEQDNGSFHVGTSVWPCSLVLAKFVERWLIPSSAAATATATATNPYAPLLCFSGKRAIELGAGCGPAGISLTVLGLDIILTDIAPVMPALRRNLKRNRPALPKAPKHAQLYWNNADQIRSLNPPFDLVIAADVVYMEDSAAQLVSAMDALVAPNGLVLLGYQLRSPEAHRVFWHRCSEVFPVIEKVPHEDLHLDYAYEEADVYIFRKSK